MRLRFAKQTDPRNHTPAGDGGVSLDIRLAFFAFPTLPLRQPLARLGDDIRHRGLVGGRHDVDPGDARAVRIRITAEGLHTLNQVRADRARAIEPQLASLNAADRQTLVDAVTVLRHVLEDAAAVPRPGASR